MKKLSVRELSTKLLLVLQRFFLVILFVLGAAIILFLNINLPAYKFEDSTLAFFYLCALLYIPISLWLENLNNQILRIGLMILPVIIMIYYCFFELNLDLPVYQYQTFILGFVFVLTSFFVPFVKKNSDSPFWNFVKVNVSQVVIVALFSGLLFGGLSLAAYSLEVLFGVEVSSKVYSNIAVFCCVLFAPIYFLSNVPCKDMMFKQDISFDKFFKILGLYILLPILAIYTLILYLYLLQIAYQWELPNGWVSTLVSILGLGGFLCMFVLYPLRYEKNYKIVNLFSRYFPVLIMPLLVLMSVGIFRRVGDYGLTINRCLIMILNLWFFGISIYLFIDKSRHLKWIVISFAIVALLSSVGPWSVFEVTKRTMQYEINQLLNEAKLLKDGKVFDNSKFVVQVDSLLSKNLSEDVKYTFRNYGYKTMQPYFEYSIKNWSARDVVRKLGIEKYSQAEDCFDAYIDNDDVDVDIRLYSRFLELENQSDGNDTVFSSDRLTVILKNQELHVFQTGIDGCTTLVPLSGKLNMLRRSKPGFNYFPLKDMTVEGNGYKLIMNHVDVKCINNDSISIQNFSAKLFLK